MCNKRVSCYQAHSGATVYIEEGLDITGERFAAEIIRALQQLQEKPRIVMILCTGESPFIGYRKMSGDKFLAVKSAQEFCYHKQQREGLYQIKSVIDNWGSSEAVKFCEHYGLDRSVKPDMKKVEVFGLDSLFPQRSDEYYAFANILHRVADLWGIPFRNRCFFEGDVYVAQGPEGWQITKIPREQYLQIMRSIEKEGLLLYEYQAYCYQNNDFSGFAFQESVRAAGDIVYVKRLKKDTMGNFSLTEERVVPLPKDHIQFAFLEGMRNQALMMREKIRELGGPDITLLGVGPSYEGKGHIGFCETNTPFSQQCCIGLVNECDATVHIAAGHAKEKQGIRNFFTMRDTIRMPKYGFISFGPAEMMLKSNVQAQSSRVIVVAHGLAKHSSLLRAIKGERSPRYPLSLTQGPCTTYIMDFSAAGNHEQKLSLFSKEDKGIEQNGECGQKQEKVLNGPVVRTGDIIHWCEEWGCSYCDKILFINPHMDDDFLAMMHFIRAMAQKYQLYFCYTSYGYTAVYNEYVNELLSAVQEFDDRTWLQLGDCPEQSLYGELIEATMKKPYVSSYEYDSWKMMGEREKQLRAKLLIRYLNSGYIRSFCNGYNPAYEFSDRGNIKYLREFLRQLRPRQFSWGTRDLVLMQFMKTAVRFIESVSSLMWLGVHCDHIMWPFNVSFYGAEGRPTALRRRDISLLKQLIQDIRPQMIVCNGEEFPDFKAHSNTEIGTYIAAGELSEEGVLQERCMIVQWAGVWDRIPVSQGQVHLVLTEDELQEFDQAFVKMYPSQAPIAPVPNAANERLQPFSQDVICNARKTAEELMAFPELPHRMKDCIKNNGGVLSYRVRRLSDIQTKQRYLQTYKYLQRAYTSIDCASSRVFNGQLPLPVSVFTLDPPLAEKIAVLKVFSQDELFWIAMHGQIILDTQQLGMVATLFQDEMKKCLKGEYSSLSMIPAWIRFPGVSKPGVGLGIDVGGSTLKIMLVRINAQEKRPQVTIEKYPLVKKRGKADPQRGKVRVQAKAEDFLSDITACVKMFIELHREEIAQACEGCAIPLGISFSFPLRQQALDHGEVVRWAKDFDIPELIGKDFVIALQEHFFQAGLERIKIRALLNDSVGSLAAYAFEDSRCQCGLVVGTGMNICYLEILDNNEVKIVNVEAGNFTGVERSDFDQQLDAMSMNPGQQQFEKMISGLYLGELFKIIVENAVRKGLLFSTVSSRKEYVDAFAFREVNLELLEKIEMDNTPTLTDIETIMIDFGIPQGVSSFADRQILQRIVQSITRRAAQLTAAALLAVLTRDDKQLQQIHHVAIEGGVCLRYPRFRENLRRSLQELSVTMCGIENEERIIFHSSCESSGVGAALTAIALQNSAAR